MPQLLGQRIRRLRMKAGWSQEQLATQMQLRGHSKLSRQRITEIETGNRKVYHDELVSFARVFGVALTELLGVPDRSPE